MPKFKKVVLKPVVTRKQYGFLRQLSATKGYYAPWGQWNARIRKLERLPADVYFDITNDPSYSELHRPGYRTLAVALNSGYPSAKHIYYVPKKKTKHGK